MPMTPVTACALLCAILYAGLVVLSPSRRPLGRESAVAALACALTAGWGVALASGDAALAGALPALEAAPFLVWTIFLSMLIAPSLDKRIDPRLRLALLTTPAALGVAVVWHDILFALRFGGGALPPAQIIGREGMAIFGLLLIENLFRNTAARRQWYVVPLAIGLGGLFAYQLFLYSDALLAGAVSAPYAAALPAVNALIAPFLALSFLRNRGWKTGVQLSQTVVLHSLTLIASGVMLLAVVTVAGLLRTRGGGEWSEVVEVAALFGSLLILAAIISSAGLKARLTYLIRRHFFARRYDYRAEWMNFIDTLSMRAAGEDLKRRAIEGIANVVAAPAGALWLREGVAENGDFVPVALWNMRLPSDAAVPADSAVIKGFRDGFWIQEFPHAIADPALGECWLAVPLVPQGRLIGFITLASPRAATKLNWESFELLRALARQAASYIAEERLDQQLQDSRRLEEYAKRFAFVAHDLKNLAAQLRLVVVNAQRHGDDPGFRADAFETIRHSVTRMTDLLHRLRANERTAATSNGTIDAVPVILHLLAARGPERARIRCAFECVSAMVAIDPDGLGSAVKLLLDNAIEASPADASVSLDMHCRDRNLVIEIVDQGAGMDVEFIHGELFRPFRSTKADGYGIGAYQTRELLRMAGGDLDVVSAPGIGTTMRIIVPLAKETAVSSAA
ncbi:MAG TPA: XrtA/PEP-CTERM system histidine kinase PrsK [Stellaceae bacterium]